MIRAHLEALRSMGERHYPITHRQAIVVSFEAIHKAAMGTADDFNPIALQKQLTIAGITAIHAAQAGVLGAIDRPLLVARIESLSPSEQRAYSMRYEEEMSDWQIAEALGISEDAVVALMLRGLLKLTGVANGS